MPLAAVTKWQQQSARDKARYARKHTNTWPPSRRSHATNRQRKVGEGTVSHIASHVLPAKQWAIRSQGAHGFAS